MERRVTSDDNERVAFARWQGQIEARLNESERDRLGLHSAQRDLLNKITDNHREVMEALRKSGKDTADAERAIIVRLENTENKIRDRENQVVGIGMLAKALPWLTGVIGAVAGWWFNGQKP